MSKLFPFIDAKSLSDYIIQVFLIIFSILVATWVGQCTEREKDEKKLAVYMASMKEEVNFEIERHNLNFYDAKKDVDQLSEALRLLSYDNLDSTYLAFSYFFRVNIRGVFRTYPPSTWDAMISAGDSELIRDLDLRQQIAGSFAFRNTTVREDLSHWDAATQNAFDQVAEFIVFPDMEKFDGRFEELLLKPKEFVIRVNPIIKSLLRQCQIRMLHLDVAKGQFEILKEMLEDIGMDTTTE